MDLSHLRDTVLLAVLLPRNLPLSSASQELRLTSQSCVQGADNFVFLFALVNQTGKLLKKKWPSLYILASLDH